MSNKYSIGQVLFLVSAKKQAIIPVQIVEINQKTTIDGNITSFMVVSDKSEERHELDSIEAEVFTKLIDVKKFLEAQTAKAIRLMVESAQKRAEESFAIGQAKKTTKSKKTSSEKEKNNLSEQEQNPFISTKKEENTMKDESFSSLDIQYYDKEGNAHLTQAKIGKISFAENI